MKEWGQFMSSHKLKRSVNLNALSHVSCTQKTTMEISSELFGVLSIDCKGFITLTDTYVGESGVFCNLFSFLLDY